MKDCSTWRASEPRSLRRFEARNDRIAPFRVGSRDLSRSSEQGKTRDVSYLEILSLDGFYLDRVQEAFKARAPKTSIVQVGQLESTWDRASPRSERRSASVEIPTGESKTPRTSNGHWFQGWMRRKKPTSRSNRRKPSERKRVEALLRHQASTASIKSDARSRRSGNASKEKLPVRRETSSASEGGSQPARVGMGRVLWLGILFLLLLATSLAAMQASVGISEGTQERRSIEEEAEEASNKEEGMDEGAEAMMTETTSVKADPDDLRKGSLAQKIDKSLQQEFQNDEKGLQESKHNISQSVANKEAVLETVARVTSKHTEEDEEEEEKSKEEVQQDKEERERSTYVSSGDEQVARLVDAHDNEFVISNPNKESSLQLQLDLVLLKDLTILVVMAFIGGSLSIMIGQPAMVGYLISGSLCGPGGFGVIQELVQVETIAQLGIMFLLFTLGLEFKFDKVKNIWPVAVIGGAIQIVLFMIVAATVSVVMGYPYKYGAFVGALLSMSSTTVVTKCLESRGDAGGNSLYVGPLSTHVQIILGTLILQDCSVGLLFAILPTLAGSAGAIGGFSSAIYVALRLCLFLAVSVLVARFVMPGFLRFILVRTKNSMELYRLSAVALCLAISWVSEQAALSLEFGAFIGGVILSVSEPKEHITMEQTDQISALFVSLFVTSIGLIMSPYFLWNHAFLLFFTLLCIIAVKTILTAVVVRAFGYNMQTSFLVGLALSNIGEFAFVLLSKGRGLGLVRRQVYFLFLGVTAFSLMFSPLLFRYFPLPQRTGSDIERACPEGRPRRKDSLGTLERTSSEESLSLEHDVLRFFERKKPAPGDHSNAHVRRLPTT